MTEELKTSIIILRETANAIEEVTAAALDAYSKYSDNPTKNNLVILSSVYAFLIIKACAFFDELKNQFLKIHPISDDPKTKDLKKYVTFFNQIFATYKVQDVRNLMVHNRKKIASKQYRYINDEDINRLKLMKSHPEYNGFNVGAAGIIKAIDKIYRLNS